MLCFFGWFVRNPLPAFFLVILFGSRVHRPSGIYFMIRPALGLVADATARRGGLNYAAFNAHLPLKPLLSD
jgi:hypothetical protein